MEMIKAANEQEKETYNNLINNAEKGHFMQTSYWADFKAQFGWQNCGQYLVKDEDKVVAAFSILKRTKMGITILYLPRGPLVLSMSHAGDVLSNIKKIAGKEKAFLVRISPAYPESDNGIKKFLTDNKFRCSKKQLQTKATTIIDLSRDEEELMASFHEKTRYNIRLAGRKGIKVTELKTEDELKALYRILEKMAQRQQYDLQGYEYYKYILENLVPAAAAKIYLAKNDEGTVVGGIVTFVCAKTRYYMYGGFDYEYRKLMGNYAIHWQIMLDAKTNGELFYDMQGIPLIKDENHPMYGFYRFKKGFNGREVEYIGEYDHSKRPLLYWLWNNIKFEKGLYLK